MLAELVAKQNQAYTTVERGIERYETSAGQKRYRVRYEDASGVHRSKSLSTLKEARQFHRQLAADKAFGNRISRQTSARLLDFVDDFWLAAVASRKSERSLIRDLQILDKWITPYLGGRLLAEIDAQDIATYKLRIEQDGAGPPTVRIALGLLSSIFKVAAVWGRETGVTTNPVILVDRPSAKRKTRPKIWHPMIGARLWWVLRRDSIRNDISDPALQDAMMVSLCCVAGIRPGEAAALQWDDIRNGQLIIDKAISLETMKATKTELNRTVPILGPLAEDLSELQQYRAGRRQRSEFIFEKRNGDRWNTGAYRNLFKRHIRPAAEYVEATWPEFSEAMIEAGAKGVPENADGLSKARLYDVGRHSYASLMLTCGTPLIQLSHTLGHSIQTLSTSYAQFMAGLEELGDDPEEMIDDLRDQVTTVSEGIRPARSRRDIRRKKA
jgi:integrase